MWNYQAPSTKEAYAAMQAQIARAEAWHAERPTTLHAKQFCNGDYFIKQTAVLSPFVTNSSYMKDWRLEPADFTVRLGDSCMLKRADGLESTPDIALMQMALSAVAYDALPNKSVYVAAPVTEAEKYAELMRQMAPRTGYHGD